jgi:hypothetical protein
MSLTKWWLVLFLSGVSLVGCSGGGGGGNGSGADVACTSTASDSVQTGGGWSRIRSESTGVYGVANLARQTLGASGPMLTMDYMVHEPPGAATALIVLIAGGQLTAGIEGLNGIGNAPSSAGGNFLVRSAHLFAAQGYRVLTIDRPSDFNDYTMGNTVSGWAYDGYRTSMAHAVDLSQIINAVNTTNLPVVIAGTSRGSISAVAQHKLGSLLALSAPLTSGANGSPIGSSTVVAPANVSEPVHVSWHELDGCTSTTPANAASLVGNLPDAVGVSISGGFAVTGAGVCDADHYHGFPGIESCAVMQATDWIAAEIATLPATRPETDDAVASTTTDMAVDIDLTTSATASPAGGALTYSLPHANSSLGGSITITGNIVDYTPPSGVNSIVDSFVYIVNEAGGGTSHNIVTITIDP